MLADTREQAPAGGRWVLMPRQRFVGRRSRARARVRERRRRVLAVLGEAIAFTALIGAFPPLRAVWVVTGLLVALLGAYVFLLWWMRSTPQARTVVLPESDLAVVRRRGAGEGEAAPAGRAALR